MSNNNQVLNNMRWVGTDALGFANKWECRVCGEVFFANPFPEEELQCPTCQSLYE